MKHAERRIKYMMSNRLAERRRNETTGHKRERGQKPDGPNRKSSGWAVNLNPKIPVIILYVKLLSVPSKR